MNRLNHTTAILMARMGSSRLPQKPLLKLGEMAMIDHVITNVKESKMIDSILVAIPIAREDDILEKHLTKIDGIQIYRGSKEPLKRFADASNEVSSNFVLRINCDCPLIDPSLIDHVIKKGYETNSDYTSTILKNTFPIGYHVELIKKNVIIEADIESKDLTEREHVTPFIYKSNKYSKLSIEAKEDNSDLRVCIDYPEDLDLISRIISGLGSSSNSYQDVIKLIRKDNWILEKSQRHHKSQKID